MKRVAGIGILITLGLASCGQSPATTPAAPGAEVVGAAPAKTGKVRILTRWAAGTLVAQEDGVLSFDTSAAPPVRAQALQPLKIDSLAVVADGDIMVSAPTDAAPYGVMVRVVDSYRSPDGYLKFITAPVALEEALSAAGIPDGDYAVVPTPSASQPVVIHDPSTIDLRFDTYTEPTDLNKIAVKAPYDDGFGGEPSIGLPMRPMSMKGLATYPIFNRDYCFTKKIINTSGVAADVQGCAAINSSATMNIRWGFLRINEFEAYLQGGIRASGRISALGNWSASRNVVLASILMPTQTFYIGPVPVVFTPKYDLVLNVNGSINAQASLSSEASMSGMLGARYNRWSGWSPIQSFDKSFVPPTFNGSVGISANAELKNRAGLYFYGTVGVAAYASPYTSLSYNPLGAPGSRGSLRAGLRGGVEFDASRIIPSAQYRRDLFDVTFLNNPL